MTKRPSLAERMKSVQTPPVQVIAAPAEQNPPPPVPGERKPYLAATREGKKRITAVVSPEEHRRLKRLSIDTGLSLEKLLQEAITDLFGKYGS